MIELQLTKEQLIKVICGLQPKTLGQCLALEPKFGWYSDQSCRFTWQKSALNELSETKLTLLFHDLI